jgi:hypothetical protein
MVEQPAGAVSSLQGNQPFAGCHEPPKILLIECRHGDFRRCRRFGLSARRRSNGRAAAGWFDAERPTL